MDLSTREGRREQGLLIQKAVERAGLSVEELANRIGCSRALIYQYLSGTTLAQPDRLQQIAAETDGKYFRATNTAKLKEIYDSIDKLEKTKVDVTEFRKHTEEFYPWALAALARIGDFHQRGGN